MEHNPFAASYKTLPENLPIFPLEGVLLMPFGRLPLNIFEPRYMQMVEDALKGDRLIGMIQPKNKDELYNVGCVGKIVEFSETEDGRYLITLQGLSRFAVGSELQVETPYRQVRADWSVYKSDIERQKCLGVDRERLCGLLSAYFEKEDMSCDFTKFDDAADGKLITCLAMVCPFEPAEKQALLEKNCCVERAQLFMDMLEIAVRSGSNSQIDAKPH